MRPAKQQSNFHDFAAFDGLTALDAHHFQNKFAPHYHDSFQVTWNRSGVFQNHINNRVYKSQPGSLVISHPREVHATVCDQPGGHSFFTLYLPPGLFHRDFQMGLKSLQYVINDLELLHLMQLIHHSITDHQLPNEQLLKRLIDDLQHRYSQNDEMTWTHGKWVSFVEKHCCEPFDLALWASHLGVNKYQFLRGFKAETGMTPLQYVMLHRVQHSLNLLASGQAITDTALATGFYDVAHFNRNFKKIMGITPGTYQQAKHCNIVQDCSD